MERIDIEKLYLGRVIYHRYLKNADGSPQKWRINGKLKTWKRQPNRFSIPIKRGLWEYGYLTESNLEDFNLEEKI